MNSGIGGIKNNNNYSTNETISYLNISNEINEPIKSHYSLLFKEIEETSITYYITHHRFLYENRKQRKRTNTKYP